MWPHFLNISFANAYYCHTTVRGTNAFDCVAQKKWWETQPELNLRLQGRETPAKFQLNTNQSTPGSSASAMRPTPIAQRNWQTRTRRKRSGVSRLLFSPFALTVEDLETTTATTFGISWARVGAPCPPRRSGPCCSAWGISRCPKSLFVSLGRSCARWARGGAESVLPGSAAATNVWAPSRSRFRRRWPRTPSPLCCRRAPFLLSNFEKCLNKINYEAIHLKADEGEGVLFKI